MRRQLTFPDWRDTVCHVRKNTFDQVSKSALWRAAPQNAGNRCAIGRNDRARLRFRLESFGERQRASSNFAPGLGRQAMPQGYLWRDPGAEMVTELAFYRRCVQRIQANWSPFLQKRAAGLTQQERHGVAAERVAENILEDLFTAVLDWSLSDVNNQVGYADLLLTRLRHLVSSI